MCTLISYYESPLWISEGGESGLLTSLLVRIRTLFSKIEVHASPLDGIFIPSNHETLILQ